MSSYHQKKLMTIAFFVLYFVLFVMTITHFAKPIKADASNYYPRGNEVTSGYYPPRIQQICWDNYYGVDWDIAKKQEKRCRVLWNSWTYAENNHLPY